MSHSIFFRTIYKILCKQKIAVIGAIANDRVAALVIDRNKPMQDAVFRHLQFKDPQTVTLDFIAVGVDVLILAEIRSEEIQKMLNF